MHPDKLLERLNYVLQDLDYITHDIGELQKLIIQNKVEYEQEDK